MFNKDDILARLQDGDSVDEIAKEMTDALNEAKAQYEAKRQAELEEARKQAEADARAYQEKEEQRALVDNIIQGVIAYLEYTGHQDMANQLINFTDADTDKIIEAFDAMIGLAEMADKMQALGFFNVSPFQAPVAKKAVKTPDDIISEFLKTL